MDSGTKDLLASLTSAQETIRDLQRTAGTAAIRGVREGGSAAKGRRKRAREPSRRDADYRACVAAITQEFICPISGSLMACPSVAEDGFLYEHAAISNWLANHDTSPKTMRTIGPRLTQDFAARQAIGKIVEHGLMPDDDAAAWHLATGRAHLEGTLPGGVDTAALHFRKAAALGSKEGAVHLVGCELKRTLTVFEESCGVVIGGGAARSAVFPTMRAWRHLRPGAKVRIVDDPREFRRLCERPAPGARYPCDYESDMEGLVGGVFPVVECVPDKQAYVISDDDQGSEWYVPFDACCLVAE